MNYRWWMKSQTTTWCVYRGQSAEWRCTAKQCKPPGVCKILVNNEVNYPNSTAQLVSRISSLSSRTAFSTLAFHQAPRNTVATPSGTKAIRSPCQTTPPLLHVWHRWWLFYYIWIMSLNLGMIFLMMENTRHEWCFLLVRCIYAFVYEYEYKYINIYINNYII